MHEYLNLHWEHLTKTIIIITIARKSLLVTCDCISRFKSKCIEAFLVFSFRDKIRPVLSVYRNRPKRGTYQASVSLNKTGPNFPNEPAVVNVQNKTVPGLYSMVKSDLQQHPAIWTRSAKTDASILPIKSTTLGHRNSWTRCEFSPYYWGNTQWFAMSFAKIKGHLLYMNEPMYLWMAEVG